MYQAIYCINNNKTKQAPYYVIKVINKYHLLPSSAHTRFHMYTKQSLCPCSPLAVKPDTVCHVTSTCCTCVSVSTYLKVFISTFFFFFLKFVVFSLRFLMLKKCIYAKNLFELISQLFSLLSTL